jgi:hypothetical protein
VFQQLLLAQEDIVGCHFHQLVVIDELQGLLQAELDERKNY